MCRATHPIIVNFFKNCLGVFLRFFLESFECDEAVRGHVLVSSFPFVQIDSQVVVRISPRSPTIDLCERVKHRRVYACVSVEDSKLVEGHKVVRCGSFRPLDHLSVVVCPIRGIFICPNVFGV